MPAAPPPTPNPEPYTEMMTSIRNPLSGLISALCALVALLWADAAIAGPNIQHWTASTGARVYLVEVHALPIIDVEVDFAAGSAYEPPAKAGLAGFTRGLLDAGAGDLDEQAISDRSADLGADIGGGTGLDRASLSLRTLSSETERDGTIDLAAKLLAHPTFPQAVLDREKVRAVAALREALTQPGTIAERRFTEAVYGNHPYGHPPTVESLQQITRDDLVAFHRDHYNAASASVAIVGDVTRAQAERIATRLTADLPRGAAPAALARPAPPAARTVRVDNPSAQAHILIGQPGIKRDDPDYYPLLVGNYTLGGGGFVSRLTKEVREKRGLAYSVYSYFDPQEQLGPFEIGLQTRGGEVKEALKVVDSTVADFIAHGPTAEELQAAKDNIINGFGLRLDSNRKILGYVAMIGFHQLPLDWLDQYPEKVAKVTAEEVRDAFARRIQPEHMVTVVVGGNGAGAPAAPAAAQ